MIALPANRIYLDSNLFIYAVEESEEWKGAATQIFAAIDAGLYRAFTSELTLAECLVKPFELNRGDAVQQYLGLIRNRPSFSVVPIHRDILIDAAELRARTRIKLSDAIHVTTAKKSACDLFISNDQRVRDRHGLPTLTLAEIRKLLDV